MPECPGCLGEGKHDFRDMDAVLGEQLTDEELARVPNFGVKFMDCPECEGTGVVSSKRLLELRAQARAAVDRALAQAKAEEEELR